MNGFVQFGPAKGCSGRVTWNWDLIRSVWSVDTVHKTLKSFSEYWGLDYGIVRQRLAKGDKKASEETRIALGRMIHDAISLPSQKDIQSAGELITLVLGDAIVNIQGLNLFVASKLLNVNDDGTRKVNIRLDTAEVARLALVQKRATDQLARLLDVSHTIQESDNLPKDAVYTTSEQPVQKQQDVIARIMKGRVVDNTKAEGESK